MASPQTLSVNLGVRSYPLTVGQGLLAQTASLLPFPVVGRGVFIVSDQSVAAAGETIASSMRAANARVVETLNIAGGESAKSFKFLEHVLDWLLKHRVDRKSVFIAVGGGVIGDLGGFASSVVLRGIDLVQVPTTLLAQIDSSIGGKNGINTVHGKNLVGTFHQPAAVLCDTDTLLTLSDRELRAGYAEGAKHGALGDAALFTWLEQNTTKVIARQPEALAEFVLRNCRFKAGIVAEDEHETTGRRALLNLGHTFGHALEAAAGYDGRLLHGEAVSIGMALAFRLSVAMGLCPDADADRVIGHLAAVGLPTTIAAIKPRLSQDADALIALMSGDKKNAGGKTVFVLTRGIGQAFLCYDVPPELVRQTLNQSMRDA